MQDKSLIKKDDLKNKQPTNSKENKTFEEYEKEISMLKKDLSEKDGEVRKMEMRWKNVQEENRILIEELSEKRKYLDDL